MFTGIIRGRGKILKLDPLPRGGRRLLLRLPPGLRPAAAGSSLALDGVCLTVEKRRGRQARFFVSPQTLSVTTLGHLEPGGELNVEGALRWGDPLDGHLVQGHVEGRARLSARRPRGRSLELVFSFPSSLAKSLIPKGSVALSGVSLTVASRRGRSVRFALIPETLRRTTLGTLKVGDEVNVETDLLQRKAGRQAVRRALRAGR